MLIIVQSPQPRSTPNLSDSGTGSREGIRSVYHRNLKQNHIIFCLPILAASFYWRAKLILISIILTLCFHLQQTKHLQALRLSGDFHRAYAPSRAKDHNRRDKTWNFDPKIKQSDGCGWTRIKKMLTFSFVTLVDVSLPATLSLSPAASCWGRGQTVRLLKEAKPKFTCKQAVNATLATISVDLLLKTNNCCVWHITFLFL